MAKEKGVKSKFPRLSLQPHVNLNRFKEFKNKLLKIIKEREKVFAEG